MPLPVQTRPVQAEPKAVGGYGRALWQFHAMHGQTEATVRIACLHAPMAETRAGCIGQAIPGGTLDLRDAQGALITQEDAEGLLGCRGSAFWRRLPATS